MTQAAKAILKRALALDPVNRAELIEALFRSFDRRQQARNDALWAAEAESRLDAYGAGKFRADKAEAVFARIGKR
jgi:putative addiction module component (TIGR02574 family)